MIAVPVIVDVKVTEQRPVIRVQLVGFRLPRVVVKSTRILERPSDVMAVTMEDPPSVIVEGSAEMVR
jgi:hypothetical protein